MVEMPFERQNDPLSNRLCGPAALCMVYRSFGITCTQAELVSKVTRMGPTGSMGSRSYLLAKDAIGRGLQALVVRVKDPIHALEMCRQPSLRAILNHRPSLESPNGHFTVLVDIEGDVVVVHDPLRGPNTRILQSDLLKLWRPPPAGASEITGNVLIVLSQDPLPAEPCPGCGSVIPETMPCPACGQSIPLRPATVLGCMSSFCPERAWVNLFCPHCDTEVMGGQGTRAGEKKSPSQAGGPETPGDDDPRRLKSLNEEIDKFLGILLRANDGVPFPGLEKHFTTIQELQAQMMDLQKKDAATSPVATAPKPIRRKPAARPPVDWNELGRRLVTELGCRSR